jgi:nicotinamide-nucleotide amidase
MTLKIGLMLIGSEILLGKIQDTNTQTLAHFLRTMGLSIAQTITVPDKKMELQSGLKYLFETCDLVITSGGLGPTEDDITKACLSDFFDCPLVFHQEAHTLAQSHYARFERPYKQGHTYSLLPAAFHALMNPVGFAPGFSFRSQDHKTIFSLPGVPREFVAMLELHLPILLKTIAPDTPTDLELFQVRTKGIPEEKIFTELCPTLWKKLETFGEVSSLPHPFGVDIGVTLKKSSAMTSTPSSAKEKLKQMLLQSPLHPYIWHIGFESIEELILKVGAEKKIKMGCVESCTGGLISSLLTKRAGSSAVFWGSSITYDNQAKVDMVSVSPECLQAQGAVSENVAKAMSHGFLKTHPQVDIALAVTGIAGPDGGSAEKPVGLVYMAIAKKNSAEVRVEKYLFKGERSLIRDRATQAGLHLILETLLHY